MRYLFNIIGLGAVQFPFYVFTPVLSAILLFQGANLGNSVVTGVVASLVALAGSALHVWYSNRKLGVTSGLERDKQVDDRTIRLFDNMEKHYEDLLKDKDSTIKTLNGIVKQKDVLIEGHRQLGAAQIVANSLAQPPLSTETPSV